MIAPHSMKATRGAVERHFLGVFRAGRQNDFKDKGANFRRQFRIARIHQREGVFDLRPAICGLPLAKAECMMETCRKIGFNKPEVALPPPHFFGVWKINDDGPVIGWQSKSDNSFKRL